LIVAGSVPRGNGGPAGAASAADASALSTESCCSPPPRGFKEPVDGPTGPPIVTRDAGRDAD